MKIGNNCDWLWVRSEMTKVTQGHTSMGFFLPYETLSKKRALLCLKAHNHPISTSLPSPTSTEIFSIPIQRKWIKTQGGCGNPFDSSPRRFSVDISEIERGLEWEKFPHANGTARNTKEKRKCVSRGRNISQFSYGGNKIHCICIKSTSLKRIQFRCGLKPRHRQQSSV